MCTGAEIALIAGTAVSSVAAMSAAGKQPAAPAIQDPIKPPAPAKAPDYNALKKSITGSGNPTALTGAEGVPLDKLLLGKATVLGA